MRIDTHAHWYPEGSLSEMVRHCRDLSLSDAGDGNQVVLFRGSVATTIGPQSHDLATRLARMEAVDVDVQVLSFGALDVSWTGRHARSLARRINEDLAAVCRDAGSRLRFLAVLPFADDEMKVELEYALGLGAVGVATTTTVAGEALDSHYYQAFWDVASDLKLPVLVHPCYPTSGPADDNGAFLVAGFPGETTLAATRMVLSGVLRAHAGAKLIWSHLGGALPMLVRRLDAAAKRFPSAGSLPTRSLAACYFDTVCTHGAALDCARATFGASRLVLGTDEPHQLEEPADIIRVVRQRAWPQDEIDAVLGGTAKRIFNFSAVS